MPTYVYVCDSCQEQFEKFQSFQEAPLKNCPQCQQETVRRVFQPVGIVFKGSGWYLTDSRSQHSTSDGSEGGNGKASKESKENKENKETTESKDTSQTSETTGSLKESHSSDSVS
jgi:putative FmdB family regulatory protein